MDFARDELMFRWIHYEQCEPQKKKRRLNPPEIGWWCACKIDATCHVISRLARTKLEYKVNDDVSVNSRSRIERDSEKMLRTTEKKLDRSHRWDLTLKCVSECVLFFPGQFIWRVASSEYDKTFVSLIQYDFLRILYEYFVSCCVVVFWVSRVEKNVRFQKHSIDVAATNKTNRSATCRSVSDPTKVRTAPNKIKSVRKLPVEAHVFSLPFGLLAVVSART